MTPTALCEAIGHDWDESTRQCGRCEIDMCGYYDTIKRDPHQWKLTLGEIKQPRAGTVTIAENTWDRDNNDDFHGVRCFDIVLTAEGKTPLTVTVLPEQLFTLRDYFDMANLDVPHFIKVHYNWLCVDVWAIPLLRQQLLVVCARLTRDHQNGPYR